MKMLKNFEWWNDPEQGLRLFPYWLVLAVVFLTCIPFSASAFAKDATWSWNTEPDMKNYRVWLCQVKGCTVQRTGNTPYAIVEHAPVGDRASVTIPDGVEGQAAVDACDNSGNCSGLSVRQNFSTLIDLPPAVPLNFEIRP